MNVIEYTDRGVIFLSGIIIFIAIIMSISELGSNQAKDESKKSNRIWALILSMFAILALYISAYYNYSTIKENINYFEEGTYLECKSGFNNYLVAKSRGWQRRDEYFINNNYILYALYCKRSKVQKEKEY